MDITATGMALISDPTTPPGGVSATTGAVGSGGGASLCTGLGLGGAGGGGGFLGGGTQSVEVGAGCESAGDVVVAGAVSVLSSVAGGGFVAAGGSNEVSGVGPGLLLKLPHADNNATAHTPANLLAARI
jgi:hypothetical protein